MNSLSDVLLTASLSVLVYMSAWFLLAVQLKRRDVVDSAWGIGFILVAWVAFSLRNNESVFSTIALLLVALWGLRLFTHIYLRNRNKKEDYRYQQLGELVSARFWLRTFFSIFMLQGLLMLMISLPVFAVMQATNEPITGIAILGASVWLFGILFEAIADFQLQQFLKAKKKGIMQSGLWRYSRHPNYFGEVTAWWGAAIMALAFHEWWGILGAWTITVLILKISGIPLLEKRYANDTAYQKYALQTSKFIPLPVNRNKK